MLKIVLKIFNERRIIKPIIPLKSVKFSARRDALSNEWSLQLSLATSKIIRKRIIRSVFKYSSFNMSSYHTGF